MSHKFPAGEARTRLPKDIAGCSWEPELLQFPLGLLQALRECLHPEWRTSVSSLVPFSSTKVSPHTQAEGVCLGGIQDLCGVRRRPPEVLVKYSSCNVYKVVSRAG